MVGLADILASLDPDLGGSASCQTQRLISSRDRLQLPPTVSHGAYSSKAVVTKEPTTTVDIFATRRMHVIGRGVERRVSPCVAGLSEVGQHGQKALEKL
jgi:hypothetical protein